MPRDRLPDVPALLEKASENFRIDSAFLLMKSRDAADWEDTGAAQVLFEASHKVAKLAGTFERIRKAFERRGATTSSVLKLHL
jgi:hypothetical protein